jgi:diguanylate cyclase (GGDEF)-like protein/putative nucleotidyltransferase with HDIG domain
LSAVAIPAWARSSRSLSQETARVLPIVAPVAVAGVAALIAAASKLVEDPPSLTAFAGMAALIVGATLAEAFPVPLELEGLAAGGVSLAAVFIVGAAVLYGWAPAVVVAFVALIAIQIVQRRPIDRLLYNAAVYTLSGAAAGVTARSFDADAGVGALLVDVVLGSAAFYATNVLLIAAVVARTANERFSALVRRGVYSTAIPFSIMASVSLMLTVLWQQSPLLSAALVGPLVAVALYQRSVHEALKAMRLALTDPVTGLGNHRHFHERLQRDLDAAELTGTPLSLCLVDVDDFKRINDRFGHPAGDRLLEQVASRLRQGGEAFRLGGDEFALLLPGRTEREALAVAETVLERVAAIAYTHGERVTVSAGIASYPEHGVERSDLVRIADSALYWSKEQGKGRASVYRPDLVGIGELRRIARQRDRRARFLAAAGLARAIDARDAYTGEHSAEVGELAGRIATRMGLETDEVELIRLAGSLHDVGKLAIPEDVLRKPGPLNEAERLVLERHPQIGFRMLDSLGVEPVATWVLHHHERWDGAGYPDRLSGDEIPLGARILFVADAYDAMTTERVYRGRLTHEQAVRELERCAGTQFDPGVVAAFKRELAETAEATRPPAESAEATRAPALAVAQ